MAILIDPPAWPAHGTLWSHLVSDTNYDELHVFAAQLRIPRRGFDLDHYDVPASLYARAIELGARPVQARDVVHRLRESGLRVRQVERESVQPIQRRQYLLAEWAALGEHASAGRSANSVLGWDRLGHELITRWNEPHRTYHDERHLEDVLLALNHLGVRGERVSPATLLAAWFHDAVYAGRTGIDEHDSAQLAASSLQAVDLPPALVQHVSEMIVATTPSAQHARVSAPTAHLLDADLSIFASGSARYEQYSSSVREEYAHVPTPEFRRGRAEILQTYLRQPSIYRSTASLQLWEERARANLNREVANLRESLN